MAENLKPSNQLSNAELKNQGFKPVFEIYNNKTGYSGKAINIMGVTSGRYYLGRHRRIRRR